MRCALHPDRPRPITHGGFRGARGLTLVETLVALAVVLTFFVGAVMAFLEIVRTKEQTQSRLDAVANARHALETMSAEFKRARLLPQTTTVTQTFTEYFVGSTTFSAGDRIDNDGDGRVDEESFNGFDDDGDWSIIDDRHARIPSVAAGGAYHDRWKFRTRSDLGDARVDEDCLFSSSTIEFQTFPQASGLPERRVLFSRGVDPDGEPNSLLMQVQEWDPVVSPPALATIAPVAHNVLSFTALYYDATVTTGTQRSNPWQIRWDSQERLATRNDVPPIPPSVYLAVTVYSGTQPLSTIAPGQKIETLTLHTIVNVEAVLADPRYDLAVREPAEVGS